MLLPVNFALANKTLWYVWDNILGNVGQWDTEALKKIQALAS